MEIKNMNLKSKYFIIGFVILFSIINSVYFTSGRQPSGRITSAMAKRIIKTRCDSVITALKNKNFERLEDYVHPLKGVRFSPYSYVDIQYDITIAINKIRTLPADTTKRVWGYYDGSGEEIRLTFIDYYKEFIYDKDFINATEIGYQRIIGQGNTRSNIYEVYPTSIVVEYHFPGFDPRVSGMDWESLRLVFEKYWGQWFLVGIVHDQWTS
jgi:hypothetical protein